jgi:hypothetical protein
MELENRLEAIENMAISANASSVGERAVGGAHPSARRGNAGAVRCALAG